MIKKVLLGLVAVIAIFLAVAAMQPADFRISRSATIAAPPSALFEQINDLLKFQDWNPWAKLDPNAKMTYTGPPSGVGSAYSWAGNGEVGEGTMTITESRPGELVRAKMEFNKPMQATNIAEFTFKPEGDKTLMTWSMSGTNGLVAKAFGLLIDCDKMVGSEFEKGLAKLKSITETAPKP
jgi:Polyketide cyclase / dehydrase and lipid transport